MLSMLLLPILHKHSIRISLDIDRLMKNSRRWSILQHSQTIL